MDRRQLLTNAAALAGAATIAQPRRAYAGIKDKVRIGIIGCGGQGEYNWGQVGACEPDVDVRVLCDVDTARTANAAKRFPSAMIVQDFRRVIERKDIDAVVVSTPDHWHAIPSVWAMQTGKHVYCEKPLAKSIWEVRTMRQVAKEEKVVTQMGTQIHAGGNYRRVVELIKAGAIGKVHKVDVWCEKGPDPGKYPATGATIPSTLDYNLWLGPAEQVPYSPQIVPFHWRWWWQFAGGVLADMGCHYMDLAHWALDLRSPERVNTTGTRFDPRTADNTVPVEIKAAYEYPARDGQPPVQLTWWHGIGGPRDDAGQVRPPAGYRNGVLFHGEKGQLVADYGSHKLLPEEQYKDYQRPAPSIPDSIGHHREWVMAIKNGGPTTCNWDYSGALAEAVLLGNVSFRLNQPVEWDSKKLKVKNAKEADWKPLVRAPYHGNWDIKS